jgi:hypothetical protein
MPATAGHDGGGTVVQIRLDLNSSRPGYAYHAPGRIKRALGA